MTPKCPTCNTPMINAEGAGCGPISELWVHDTAVHVKCPHWQTIFLGKKTPRPLSQPPPKIKDP